MIGSEPEKMANLLAMIKVLRRRDLVHMIKEHIKEQYEQPEVVLNLVRSIVDSSGPKLAYIRNQSDEQRASSLTCCVQDCCCCKLTCYSSPCCDLSCCSVVLAILFTFFTVAAILAWFADIPEVTRYLNSTDDLRRSGPYIVAILAFFALCSALCRVYLFCSKRNRPDPMLSRSQDNESVNSQVCGPGSYSVSNSAHTSPVLTRVNSNNSIPVTASCSLSSVASQSRIPPVSELEPVPDGLHKYKDDNVEFYTPISSINREIKSE